MVFPLRAMVERGEHNEEILKYIAAVLNLYCNTCKGRN